MMHDPQRMSIQKMTVAAQQLVINKLETTEWPLKYKHDIKNIVNFINNGVGSDGAAFLAQMKRTDEYRKQNFVDTHPEIAIAMGY